MSSLNKHKNLVNSLTPKCYSHYMILFNLIIETATGSDSRKTIPCK